MSTRLMTAASTIAASTGCGRFRSRPDANSTTMSVKRAATSPESGVRAPALSLTSDCDMPPLTGNPRPSPDSRLPAPSARSSWLASKRLPCFCANMRPMADVSTAREHEAGERQRQQVVQLVPADVRQSEGRQPLRNVPEQRDAGGFEIQKPRRDNARDDDEKRDRPVLQPELAGDERGEGDAADQQRGRMRVSQMPEEVGRALPEIAMRSLEPEELGQLRARQVERQARLETDQDGFGEEADRVSGADQPGDEGDRGHHERHARGERGVARRVAAAQLADRCADEQRQRRGDGDDRVAGAAEQPEDETREQTRVESRFRCQARERRVADSCGQQVRGERQAGDEVRPEPRRAGSQAATGGRRGGFPPVPNTKHDEPPATLCDAV